MEEKREAGDVAAGTVGMGEMGEEGGEGDGLGQEMVTCVGWHLLNTNSFITLYRYIQ